MTIKTQIGWITAFEENNKISCIKFGKRKVKAASNMSDKITKHLEKTEQVMDDFF